MKYFWLGFFVFLSTIVFVYKFEIKQAVLDRQQSIPNEQQLRVPEVLVETRSDRKMAMKDLLFYRQKDRLFLKARLVLGYIDSDEVKDGTMVEVAAKTGKTLELFQKDIEAAFQTSFVRLEMRNKMGFIIGSDDLYFKSDILPIVRKEGPCVFFEINCNKDSHLDLEDIATLTAVLDSI